MISGLNMFFFQTVPGLIYLSWLFESVLGPLRLSFDVASHEICAQKFECAKTNMAEC